MRYQLRPISSASAKTGHNTLALAQGWYGDHWVSLGTYYFTANGNEFVSLGDVTGEATMSHTLVFDAIKFTPR